MADLPESFLKPFWSLLLKFHGSEGDAARALAADIDAEVHAYALQARNEALEEAIRAIRNQKFPGSLARSIEALRALKERP